jgi:hypothetical protein
MSLRPKSRLAAFRSPIAALAAAAALAAPAAALAEVPPQRTFYRIPSSNGHGAVLLDLQHARVTHFREHLYATEEPEINASGGEVWNGNQPAVVKTRDLLYDAYFGLRSGGTQRWLTTIPVDLDASGYAPWEPGKKGGTGVVTMVQKVGDLEATQFFFAPRALSRASFVMAMRVRNTGAAKATQVAAFSLHNFHLGYGRPGSMEDNDDQYNANGELSNKNATVDENGETIELDASGGKTDFIERAFAGVIVARALAPVAHYGTAPTVNVYKIVNDGGTQDLPDVVNGSFASGSVGAFQWDLGDIDPGTEKWVGVAFAHHGDPFAKDAVQGSLDAYAGALGAKALVDAEIAGWAAFQKDTIKLPGALSGDEETLLRQSAAVLQMAQVREESTFLREFLAADGQPRFTLMGTSVGNPPAQLPATVAHRGSGAVLASLPPGEWTYAWIRDGAYAVTAMATLGMSADARAGLLYYLNADAGRFQGWDELKPYAMPPYQISLTRYHGFGIEETDFNDFGPNLEFDGFGLFLWALRSYEVISGDQTLVNEQWPVVSTKVADVLVALIDPETGLIRRDSSIWETHWKGRERFWTYTSITAARGLCDAAALAERMGDSTRAEIYKTTGEKLREAIATKLTDASGALASNAEELASGSGYWDAAVIDGIAMGLFDPKGPIAAATVKGLDEHLLSPAGAGWSRNDDRSDHPGQEDLSPWGSEYDSAEWVVTNLRGAVAAHLMGDSARAERLLAWVRDQSLTNYLAVAETYDESTGKYKFNAPMVGFGAGVYALALAARSGKLDDPACGAYYQGPTGAGGAGGEGGSGGSGAVGAGGAGGAGQAPGDGGGCDCRLASLNSGGSSTQLAGLGAWVAASLLALARRRRPRAPAARG